jgi:pimeloyl-ACP methyl ester carboxylesterase
VLLHHGLGAVRSWRQQIPALAKAGYQVIAYDRWGFGRSDPRERYAIPGFQEDLADLKDLLEDLEIERAALVGHSDGGKVAIYYAAAFPQRVAALVLIATHAFIEPKMESGILGVREQFEQDARFRDQLARVHGDQAGTVFWGWFNGWANPANRGWDLRPRLREIACPAMVIQGVEDEHATPEHAMQIAAAILNAELWLVPEAGHMLPQEFPEALNARLLDFLARAFIRDRIPETSIE